MFSIHASQVPSDTLLDQYRAGGAYADCYVADMDGVVSLQRYATAFYTTPVFKLERLILKWAISKPSTDLQAERLAAGTLDAFAAWRVEGRTEHQLLMRDIYGRTRSWLMVASATTADGRARTRLYFGSAVVAAAKSKTGGAALSLGFGAMLVFHRLYSRVLLHCARSRLQAQQDAGEMR